MEAWSITAEKLRGLWSGYWKCPDRFIRIEMAKSIRAVTRTIQEQNAYIRTLEERCAESDRLLIALTNRKQP